MKLFDIRKYHILTAKKINKYYLEMEKLISQHNPQLLEETKKAFKDWENNKEIPEDKKTEIYNQLQQFFKNPQSLSEEETSNILSISPEEILTCFIDGTEEKSV